MRGGYDPAVQLTDLEPHVVVRLAAGVCVIVHHVATGQQTVDCSLEGVRARADGTLVAQLQSGFGGGRQPIGAGESMEGMGGRGRGRRIRWEGEEDTVGGGGGYGGRVRRIRWEGEEDTVGGERGREKEGPGRQCSDISYLWSSLWRYSCT